VNKVLSDETRKKIGEASKGRLWSDATKTKKSKSMLGENNHFYSRTHSDVVKQTISKSNHHKPGSGRSKYKGVSWSKHAKRWQVTMRVKKTKVHLGYFDTEQSAAKVYNEKAIELYGEDCYLNDV